MSGSDGTQWSPEAVSRSLSGESEDEFTDECTLFVGDLHRGITEEHLQNHFQHAGEIQAVAIKKDKFTQQSLGYGFVQFKNREDADNAKNMLHKSILGGRSIRIGWAQKNTNIFVADLDAKATTESLREAFSKFGTLCEEETYVRHKVYGFVKFKRRKDAEEAKKAMDGTVLDGTTIRVGWGETNIQKYCVNVQFHLKPDEDLSDDEIGNLFEQFGVVKSVIVPRDVRGKMKGFGFIYYDESEEGEEAAQAAITALNNSKISNGTILVKCRFGKKPVNKKKITNKRRQGNLGRNISGDQYNSPYYNSGNYSRNGPVQYQQPYYPRQYGTPNGGRGGPLLNMNMNMSPLGMTMSPNGRPPIHQEVTHPQYLYGINPTMYHPAMVMQQIPHMGHAMNSNLQNNSEHILSHPIIHSGENEINDNDAHDTNHNQ